MISVDLQRDATNLRDMTSRKTESDIEFFLHNTSLRSSVVYTFLQSQWIHHSLGLGPTNPTFSALGPRLRAKAVTSSRNFFAR